MDRRQQKTREAIFHAFADLLAQKPASTIAVQEIIDAANVGRATFYAHFETKEQLVEEMSDAMFTAVIDEVRQSGADDSVFLCLLYRLQKDDRRLLTLLGGNNHELFLPHFKTSLQSLIRSEARRQSWRFTADLPEDYAVCHIAAVFSETVHWWITERPDRSPDVIERYFRAAIQPLVTQEGGVS